MTLEEYMEQVLEQKTKEEMREFTITFWNQASAEDRAKVIEMLTNLASSVKKAVRNFWAMCGVVIAENWVVIDGTTYTLSGEMMPNHTDAQKAWKEMIEKVHTPRTLKEIFQEAQGGGHETPYNTVTVKTSDYMVKGDGNDGKPD